MDITGTKNDWIKEKILGSGSFGTVILWRNEGTNERIATKTCKWNIELTEKHKARWTREVEIVNHISHSNIVSTRNLPQIIQLALEPLNPSKLPILCMEYCRGGDLRRLLNLPHFCCGLKEVQVRKILIDLKNAVHFLHCNKITHRDLKPENIVMNITNDSELIDLSENGAQNICYKLIDLGYAKELDSNSICASFVGTLQYLAPEILYRKKYSNSVDYWSMGLIAFEIICGIRPFLPTLAPVQWMPFVKNKSHETINVYLNFYGDVEYSKEICKENYVSNVFKKCIERWLQTALEWDPKLRGREVSVELNKEKNFKNKLIIFDSLHDILSRKIINIFYINTLSKYSYEVQENTSILEIKMWLETSTGTPVKDQTLISKFSTNSTKNEDIVIKYWADYHDVIFFLYNKTIFVTDCQSTITEDLNSHLENPKVMHSYENTESIFRYCLYFITIQIEKYDLLILSLNIRLASLKQESKEMLLNHNSTDKKIAKLITTEEIITILIENAQSNVNKMIKKRYSNYTDEFEKIFSKTNHLKNTSRKIHVAWSQVSEQIKSVIKLNHELSSEYINKLSKYSFKSIYNNALRAYTDFQKQSNEKNNKTDGYCCQNIIKLFHTSYALKRKFLEEINEQQIILRLNEASNEIDKITNTIMSIVNNVEDSLSSYTAVHNQFYDHIWATINLLCLEIDNFEEPKQKQDFKIGHCVSNHRVESSNNMEVNEFHSLIEESLVIRKKHNNLVDKLHKQKMEFINSDCDFTFLKDS